MQTAVQIIMGVVTNEWVSVTTLAQNIKGKNAFRGSYAKVVSQLYSAAQAGLVEIKHERTGKSGPQKRFVRRKATSADWAKVLKNVPFDDLRARA